MCAPHIFDASAYLGVNIFNIDVKSVKHFKANFFVSSFELDLIY